MMRNVPFSAAMLAMVVGFAGCSWSVHLGSKRYETTEIREDRPAASSVRATGEPRMITSRMTEGTLTLRIVGKDDCDVQYVGSGGGRRTLGRGSVEVPVDIIIRESIPFGNTPSRFAFERITVKGEFEQLSGGPDRPLVLRFSERCGEATSQIAVELHPEAIARELRSSERPTLTREF